MQPKVSVCLITYNHLHFIKQAMDGALMQQCDFDYEIVIGDDCSTDGTTAIVEEYAKQHPNKIRLNKYPKNVGMIQNWKQNMAACKGPYIALLEGDDFWTDPLKLQKQVAVLDKNPSYSFCCHDVETIYGPGVPEVDMINHIGVTDTFTIKDILSRWGFIPTGSIVFRKSMLDPFPEWVYDKKVKCIDLIVELMLSSKGPFYYINEKMGKYRIHLGGVSQIQWLGREHLFNFDIIYILELFNRYTNFTFSAEINSRMEFLYRGLLKVNPSNSDAAKRATWGLYHIDPKKNRHILLDWMIQRYHLGGVYKLYKRIF